MTGSALPSAIQLPDGCWVRGRGLRYAAPAGPSPEYGLYLGTRRLRRRHRPPWPHEWIDWPDFLLPRDSGHVIDLIHTLHDHAHAGQRVEVACGGGVGRTGTVIACLAVLAGQSPADAISWTRTIYHHRAIETPWQRRWITRFAAPGSYPTGLPPAGDDELAAVRSAHHITSSSLDARNTEANASLAALWDRAPAHRAQHIANTQETGEMPNVKVTFDRIEVDKDGDPGAPDGKGDFYWTLEVNGARVSHRDVSNPLQEKGGGSIDLGASKSVELRRNEELLISGFLAEKDSGLTGKDERAPIHQTYDVSENWGDGPHQISLRDRKMDCTLHYTIQVE